MALNNMGLGFMFTARDLASGAFDRLKRKFEDLEAAAGGGGERIKKAFAQVGVGLATMTVGIVGLASGFALANVAGEFEQAVAAVGAVANASAADLKLLRDAAIQAGIATQFSPTEAANGLQELAASGFNARESAQLLIPTLDLAAGSLGKLGVAEAAGLASQAIKAFGLDATKASVTVDQMIQATNAFALSADELPLALGIAARGAGAAKQSFEDTLVAIGLVKNVVPGVERGATAVAVAMERMVDPKTQRKLQSLGIAVTDAQGRFRSVLDVLGELAPALDGMTDKKRADFLLKTFGREALGGVQAILTQMTTGVRGANGEMLRGAAALKFLRDQMKNAGGTAAKFRDQMLDTFAGQKTLLSGSLQTLAILLGEPFAAVFKPVVAAVVRGINRIIEVVQKMPAALKKGIATVVAAAAGLTTLLGALIAAKGGLFLLGLAAKAMSIAFVSALLPLLPLVLGVAAATAGFFFLFRKRGEGFGAFVERLWSKTKLFFQGLIQVFRDGGFSGAVMEELGKAENRGLKRFVIWLYQAADRIGKLLDGIGEGFRVVWRSWVAPAVEGMGKAFYELGLTLRDLGERVGGVFGEFISEVGGLMGAGQGFKSAGEVIGGAIAGLIGFVVRGITLFVKFANVVATASNHAWMFLQSLGEQIGEVGARIYLFFAEKIPNAFATFVSSVRRMVKPVTDWFQHLAATIMGTLTRLNDFMIETVRKIPRWALSEQMERFAAQETYRERVARLKAEGHENPTAAAMTFVGATQMEILTSGQADPGAPAIDQAKIDALVAAVTTALQHERPVVVQVDGETIARAAADGARKSATRAFVEGGPMTVPSI